ncbi:probable E3 SUMO-protein ligase RNF212 [Oncorhynchus keta]|uniref:probable E3 SUMO-protein ligase RNF212 n=1 Tax=Oncorhynchus keta TaxID=8018 RepID=UPI0015FD3837|nr:probable E3 SUMO-protein ligase RNF212 [Oncorhynchus keta]
MPYWICCNSCFNLPGPDCQLAVASCGHLICNVCFQKGKQGECMICKAKCQVTPLSDKSSAEVKALFSDINSVATKHFTEISKVLLFQARHQKRLLVHYQKRNEKLEDVLLKMKQEIQQMSKKITAQDAYIAKLENTLQHQRYRLRSIDQSEHPGQPLSHLAEMQMTANLPYRRDTGWETAIFKPPSAYGHPFMSSLSMSSLGATCPPP